MRSLFVPKRRILEATPAQIVASGAYAGNLGGTDPIDGDRGYARLGGGMREVPRWTHERARTYSVAAYRMNPMARAIIDTYTAFCVGDTGVSLQVSSPDVRAVAEEFWNDDENGLINQELYLRDLMIMGETCLELMQGVESGVVRLNPIDTTGVIGVSLRENNPLWPDKVVYQLTGGDLREYKVVRVNEDTENLRDGEVVWWAPWKTILQDTRSMPFLTPILDQLDSYDTVMSNLVDRTTLARYFLWDVTVHGTQQDIERYIDERGGRQMPTSGAIEFHNESVEWTPKQCSTNAQEDTVAGQSVLTQIAGGAGLSKTWLAESEGANRATSLSMAEPVRRRVNGVQKMFLAYMSELVRFAIDRAVASGRIKETVTATDQRTGREFEVPASQSIQVTGPEIAAADAQVTAEVMMNLSKALIEMQAAGVLSPSASQIAAKKAWEDYVGVNYSSELNDPNMDPNNIADYITEMQLAMKGGAQAQPFGGPGAPQGNGQKPTTGQKPAASKRKVQKPRNTGPSQRQGKTDYRGELNPDL